ncbi:unnamed protein product [Victoria cruziana]
MSLSYFNLHVGETPFTAQGIGASGIANSLRHYSRPGNTSLGQTLQEVERNMPQKMRLWERHMRLEEV